MRALHTLIQVNNAALQEHSSRIAELYAQIDAHQQVIQQTTMALEREQALIATAEPDLAQSYLASYLAYSQHQRAQQEQIIHQIEQLELQVAAVREEIWAIFSQSKRYQLLLDKRQAEQDAAAAKYQQQELLEAVLLSR